MIKTCTKCHLNKPATLEFFYAHPHTKDKLMGRCKQCHIKRIKDLHNNDDYREQNRIYWKNWRIKNRNKRLQQERERDRARRYKLSPQQFRELLSEQNNNCAICRHPFQDETPHVDHNHETMRARGLLCLHCNTVLGYAKESVIILQNAIIYLEKYEESR